MHLSAKVLVVPLVIVKAVSSVNEVEEAAADGLTTLEPVFNSVEPSYNLQLLMLVAVAPPVLYSNGIVVNFTFSPEELASNT